MLNTVFRAYASSSLALKVDSWPEKIFRRTVWLIDFLESTIVFHTRRFLLALRRAKQPISETEWQSLDDTLLAVYCLKANGLTFDFMTFLGIVEMERRRCRLKSCKVILYAPPEFPIYQWQRHKVFNNMNEQPLIRAKREHVLAYVLKLAEVARIFSTTMRSEVVCDWRELIDAVYVHPHTFPRSSRWTGRFCNMTKYLTYSRMKYQINDGQDAVSAPRHYLLGSWFNKQLGSGKLIVTLNLRNQKYATSRNASLNYWDEFFSNAFIKKHFHFIVFNDAETPVTIKDSECITFCDKYIHDNFRRFKVFLNVGLHIGTASGSSAIVSYSDVAYLLFGPHSVEDMKAHLDPDRASIEDDYLYFDKCRRHQMFSLKCDRIMDSVRLLLSNISESKQVLERYPDNVRAKLNEVLLDWPSQLSVKQILC